MKMIRRKNPRSLARTKDLRESESSLQHSLSFCHPAEWGIILLVCLLALQLLFFPAPSAALGAGVPAASAQGKPSPNDCIFYATVFTDQGRLLQGAEIHAHPVGHKKPLFEAWSDRRGEFAIRVSKLGDYEIEVKAQGYVTQTRTVTAQEGEKIDMVFHMVLQTGKKP